MNVTAAFLVQSAVALGLVWVVWRQHQLIRRMQADPHRGIELRVSFDGHDIVLANSEALYFAGKFNGGHGADEEGWTDLLRDIDPSRRSSMSVHFRPWSWSVADRGKRDG